jgi:hypothetical protein
VTVVLIHFAFFVLRHLKGAGQAVTFLAAAPPLGDLAGGLIEGGLHVHAADQLDVGGQMPADGLAGVLAISEHAQPAQKAYALACFNVLAHNRDDHVKNFSFLHNDNHQWVFAPAPMI